MELGLGIERSKPAVIVGGGSGSLALRLHPKAISTAASSENSGILDLKGEFTSLCIIYHG